MSNLFIFFVKTVSVFYLFEKQKFNKFGFMTQYEVRSFKNNIISGKFMSCKLK